MTRTHPLRPLLPGDIEAACDLFERSVEELAEDDYDASQRAAWAGLAHDADALAARLKGAVTLVIEIDGGMAGFASLKDNKVIDMLYVHPDHARKGVATTLVDALERLAAGRGSTKLSVDASETAGPFFAGRGYEPKQRNTVALEDQWLTNTTMVKTLGDSVAGGIKPGSKD